MINNKFQYLYIYIYIYIKISRLKILLCLFSYWFKNDWEEFVNFQETNCLMSCYQTWHAYLFNPEVLLWNIFVPQRERQCCCKIIIKNLNLTNQKKKLMNCLLLALIHFTLCFLRVRMNRYTKRKKIEYSYSCIFRFTVTIWV